MKEFDAYLETLRSATTKYSYGRWVRMAVKDPDAFLQLARTDRPRAEKVLIDFSLEKRKTAGGAMIRNYRAAVKGLLDYYDVPLSWKKIKAVAPPARTVASDRAPERVELHRMWAVAGPRERLAMSFLVSLGGRRGAFHFPSVRGGWGYMKLQDVVFLEDGTAAVTVYPGEPEEYRTLVSPEAVQQLKLCLELRERVGENLAPESPVMRDEWRAEYGWHPEEAHVLEVDSISVIFKRLKLKAGITTTSRNGGFKAAHGFRKFFKSNFPACPQHGDLEAEVLMGHRRSYDKASWEHLRERYRIAIPHLVIDEKFALKVELETAKKDHAEGVKDLRLDYLTLKDELSEMKKRDERMEAWMKLWSKNPEAARKALTHAKPPPPPE